MTECGTRTMNAKKSRARLWLLWHSWLALPIWAYLFFICATGTVATMSREWMWVADPTVRADSAGPDLPPSALVAAIEREIPGAKVLYLRRDEPYLAVEATFARPDGRFGSAWIDPVGGAITSLGGGTTFPEFMRALHGWLLAPWISGYSWGWYAVTVLAVPMLGSLVTGIVVYKRFWRVYASWPKIRVGNGARLFWGDLHRLGGAWALWFIAIIASTAAWFLIEAVLYDFNAPVAMSEAPVVIAREDLPVAQPGQPLPRADLDRAVTAALSVLPGARPTLIMLPTNAFEPVVVSGFGRVPLFYDRVAVNPYTAAIVAQRLGGDLPLIVKTTQIMRILHIGNFGGLPVKIVWCAFGLILSTLVFSGMMIWTKRTFRKTVETARSLAEENVHA